MLNSSNRRWRRIKTMRRRRRNVSCFVLDQRSLKSVCEKNAGFCSPAPKCGFIKGNEKIMVLLEKVKPEIVAFRETIITVSRRSQHATPTASPPPSPPSLPAGFLLDPAPHPQNRRRERLRSRHPGNPPPPDQHAGEASSRCVELCPVFSDRKRSWSESLR